MAEGIGGTAPCETPAPPPPVVAWNDRDAHPDPHRAAAPTRKHTLAAFSPNFKGAALARARKASISSKPFPCLETCLEQTGWRPLSSPRTVHHGGVVWSNLRLEGGGWNFLLSRARRFKKAMSLESGERLNGFFYEEVVTEDLYLKMELKKIGFNGESKFQVTARVVLGKLLRPGSTWNVAAGGPAPRSPCSRSCGSHRDLDDVAHTAGSQEHHYKAAPQQRGRLRTADPWLKIPHTL